MTIDGIPLAPTTGPLPEPDFVAFANMLDRLALHAATMGDDDPHASCLYCTTNILLARVVRFGDQFREDEKRARS